MNAQTIRFKAKNRPEVCVHLNPIHFKYLKNITILKFDNNISNDFIFINQILKYLYKN